MTSDPPFKKLSGSRRFGKVAKIALGGMASRGGAYMLGLGTFICEVTSTRRWRSDPFGHHVKLPPVTIPV